MFFSPSPLKSGKVTWISPIGLFDHLSSVLSHFYKSKFRRVYPRERWNSNFVDFTALWREWSSLNQNLSRWNGNISREHHSHCTQEFTCRYLVELFIFFKEIHFYQNTEKRHLAYSFLQEPCIVIDRLASSLKLKVLSMFRQTKSGAKSERFDHLDCFIYISSRKWDSQIHINSFKRLQGGWDDKKTKKISSKA